jgi:glycosyltransferase involved in cell wall biosynthesis
MTLRTFNLIASLAKQHSLYLVSLLQDPGEAHGLEQLRRYCRYVAGVQVPVAASRLRLAAALLRNLVSPLPFVCQKYDVPAARALLRELIVRERFDAVHYDLLPLAVYRGEAPGLRAVLVEHNIESDLLFRRMRCERNPLRKAFLYVQWRKLRSFERAACGRFGCCIVVSQTDRQSLVAMAPDARVAVVPNGTDTRYFIPATSPARNNSLVFVGSQAWYPNRDGLRYFLRAIFAQIRAAVPDVTLDLVGKTVRGSLIPPRYRSCVRVHGQVDDIRPYVHAAAVYVVPLRIGGGTRLKILDAMAMGKAIVSTAVGCEGIEATGGEHIIIADDPETFATQTVRLLADPVARERLGTSARHLAEQRYEWKIVYATLGELYKEEITRRTRSSGSGNRGQLTAPAYTPE